MNWAFERAGENGAVLFFPDQHLGRNTGLKMGIPENKMPTWIPNFGSDGEITGSKVILWHGFCSVHKRFTVEQIQEFRQNNPNGVVIVHPECPKETVAASDENGSTQFIRNYVQSLGPGAKVAIGTEINMVARLANEHPDKSIECLDDKICPCSTMYMIHPAYLLNVLEKLVEGEIVNQISVPRKFKKGLCLLLSVCWQSRNNYSSSACNSSRVSMPLIEIYKYQNNSDKCTNWRTMFEYVFSSGTQLLRLNYHAII